MRSLVKYMEGLLDKSNKTKVKSFDSDVEEGVNAALIGNNSILREVLKMLKPWDFRNDPKFESFKDYKPGEDYYYASYSDEHDLITVNWVGTKILDTNPRACLGYKGDRVGIKIEFKGDETYSNWSVVLSGQFLGRYSRPGDRYVGKFVWLNKSQFDRIKTLVENSQVPINNQYEKYPTSIINRIGYKKAKG